MTKKELVHKIKETIINGSEQKAVELVLEFLLDEVKYLIDKYEDHEKVIKLHIAISSDKDWMRGQILAYQEIIKDLKKLGNDTDILNSK